MFAGRWWKGRGACFVPYLHAVRIYRKYPKFFWLVGELRKFEILEGGPKDCKDLRLSVFLVGEELLEGGRYDGTIRKIAKIK